VFGVLSSEFLDSIFWDDLLQLYGASVVSLTSAFWILFIWDIRI